MKKLNKSAEIQKQFSAMRLPQMGINYRASLQQDVSKEFLDLKPVNSWLGPTMDERGIAYNFWFRISYSNSRLEILLRYDPRKYNLPDAKEVVDNVILNLKAGLKKLNIVHD